MGAHQAGGSMRSASKGNEREAFINAFLSEILPPQFRFGSGDITDQSANRSGQLDIVIEFPFVPSIPIVAGKSPRLYLAEGVLAVIEVKSDISVGNNQNEAKSNNGCIVEISNRAKISLKQL